MRTRTRRLTAAGIAGVSALTNAVAASPAGASPAAPPDRAAPVARRPIRQHANRRDALAARSRRLTDPALDPVVGDRLRRYLDRAAHRGNLLDTSAVQGTTTDAGAVVVSPTSVTVEAVDERVALDDDGGTGAYAFRAATTKAAPAPGAERPRAPGLGYDSPIIYSIPVAQIFPPDVVRSDNMNFAEWGGDVYFMPDDMDKSADFFSYRRWTTAYPQRGITGAGALTDYTVTGIKAEAGIAGDWMPWFLGKGAMQPDKTESGQCRDVILSASVYGFGIEVPGIRMCETVEVIPYPGAPQMAGLNYDSGFVYSPNGVRTVGFNVMVKMYPGVWPVWNDYAFASFCRTSFLECEQVEKGWDNKRAGG